MGVSGSGKSTVGAELASRLGRSFADGDDFHSDANRAKMASGQPLTDTDRWPWLETIGAYLRDEMVAGRPTVVACSALKREYRDRIRAAGASVYFVFLTGNEELLLERMRARAGHFMKADMLASQLAILEPLARDEFGVTVNVAGDIPQIVTEALADFAATEVPGIA
ncbi:Gluconokinase OS=Tsukamurella paurometabola (strain ATCC 8368 / DSM / CCUG 35730 / CIP 100753/ JCM 10117 / KCTC 9821 / NBRC 16120 / NCIMB 702349 / NCTC 13040) OX=521096 GN=Tpau_2124 PE=3 SV=1 [Tsukamurella paurometabola]|nr:Thermoresistant gluconokinase [Tsukamurella paurometabola]